MNLDQLRERIDEIDAKLLELLNQRMEVVHEVGALKRTSKTVIYRPEREKFIIDRLYKLNKGGLTRAAIEAIFLEIFSVSRHFELPERVAYLGPEGSFTHQAAESRFGAVSEYVALNNIKQIFDSVETERVRFGVVPIENNQEGSVAETIDQLCERDIKIVAEVPMSIHFTLSGLEDRLEKIHTIYSKDIAFRQCKNFLENYFGDRVNLVEVASTSKAAKLASEEEGAAAICSHIAAKLYNLPVLFENIEDSKSNRTRFFIISKNIVNQKSDNDKTTILAKIKDEPGGLVEFLNDFKREKINLCKLESRPARIKASFKYFFLIDFEGHYTDLNAQRIFEKYGERITFLGSYVRMV
ncbi:prephenate dehydratase [Rapidithrix thailandica]|uniref:Bifunctional chorismate mutase/prephenate dehydratase n=1 Tax=Rapidithrix thailandica TaxID=413964 RepID=A0AAW9SA51_9BACT